MRSSVASVVGVATDERWGQVLTTPHAYGVIEVYSKDGIARVRGIQILTKLTRLFLTPPVSLSKLAAIADVFVSEDVVSLMLLVPIGNTLYLVVRGEGCVYLKRGNELAKLIDGKGDLSGDIRNGDTVIAASSGFAAALPSGEIMGAFDHLAPPEVAEKLSLRLHEHEGGVGGAAALIFKIDEHHDDEDSETKPEGEPLPQVTTPTFRLKFRQWYLRLREGKRTSLRHILVYGIVALFGLSVVLGVRREYVTKRQSTITETMKQAKFSFDEGMALLELNPVKGRERLSEARDTLSPIVAKKQRSSEARQAQTLYDEVVSSLTRAMRITSVTPELYFDMGLIKSGAMATDMSLFGDALGVIDGKNFTAFTLSLQPKAGSIVGGGGALSGGNHIAAYGDKLYIWTPAGIHQIRLTDKKTVSSIVPASGEWSTITDMTLFAGNVYLLDTGKSRIWKYVSTEAGFSTLFEYLNPDTLLDLTQTTNMAIDGSVWLGTSNGAILRFTAGKENSFTPQGADTPLGKRLSVFTQDEVTMLYVLDHDNSRVVVFDKDGLYMAQYGWAKDFSPTEFSVSETLGKIFLLRDGKIYSVDLK